MTLLIDRLTTSPCLSKNDAEELNGKFITESFKRMRETGCSYGEAAGGGLEFLNRDDGPAYVRSIQDDLLKQVEIVNETLDYWFNHGEPIPPHYMNRIAVILRKRKEFAAEKKYLQALALHFYGSRGRTWEQLSKRVEKLGVVPPLERLPRPHHIP